MSAIMNANRPCGVFVATLGLAAMNAGCGGDNSATDDGRSVIEGPLYLVHTSVSTTDSSATYLLLVNSLDADVEPDYENAVALDGFHIVYGRERHRDIYTGSFDTPELTKWRVNEDGTFTKGPVMNLANLGVVSASPEQSTVTFVSDTKAYFPDPPSGRLIVWNPSTMEITGEIDLGIEPLDGLEPGAPASHVLRPDGKLFIPIHWASDDFVTLGDRVRVITVDTETDSVVATDDDDRCGYAFHATLGDDGATYIDGGPWTRVYADVLGEGFGATPCHLRVIPPESSFDDSYFVDLSTLTEGRPTGDFFPLDAETAVIRAFHPEDAPNEFDGDTLAYTFQRAYRWWFWRIGEPSATLVQTDGPAVVTGQRFHVDGRRYVVDATADYASSTLISFSGDGAMERGLTVRGSPYSVIRIQ